jgi:hypothetical protein
METAHQGTQLFLGISVAGYHDTCVGTAYRGSGEHQGEIPVLIHGSAYLVVGFEFLMFLVAHKPLKLSTDKLP